MYEKWSKVFFLLYRAVFQLYPETPEQIELITSCATKSGFTGGLLVDYPHSAKAKKYYLCLFAGQSTSKDMPQPKLDDEEEVTYEKRSNKRRRVDKPIKKSKEWILAKKERQRKQGKDVRPDTKYTGRKRPMGF